MISIRAAILVSYLCLAGISALLGVYNLGVADRLGKLTAQLFDDTLLSVSYARKAQALFNEAGRAVRGADALVTTSVDDLLRETIEDIDIALHRASSDESRSRTSALRQKLESLLVAQAHGDRPELETLDGMSVEFDHVVELFSADGFLQRMRAEEIIDQAKRWSLATLGIAIAAALLIALWVSKAMLVPLTHAVGIASAVSKGILTSLIDVRGPREMSTLLCALATMQRALAEHMRRIEGLRAEARMDAVRLEAQAAELESARETAEAANRAKSQFLAMMSHELRTPMTGILGLADLILGSDVSEETRQQLGMLRTSAGSLLTLLNDVLDFSKIEAGELRLEMIEFEPAKALEAVQALLGPAASRKGVTLSVELTQVPPWVRGDPTRLRQVLLNLVGNAVKFTEAGRIDVRLRGENAETGEIVIVAEIKDSGIGMTQEQISRLFMPFVQADASTSRRFGGTGLGLAITKRLVESMGGKIDVSSAPGVGSLFRFTLRVGVAEAPADDKRAGDSWTVTTSAASVRILLAEDNDINRTLIQAMLKRMGHDVEAVANGRLAVDMVCEHEFDLVLMDMQMPVLDGPGAVREIRQMEKDEGRRTPIIALTADALPERQTQYMEAGLDGYMTKPVDWRKLAETIGRHAKRQIRGGVEVHSVAVALASAAEDYPLVDLTRLRELTEVLGPEEVRQLMSAMPDAMRKETAHLKAAACASDAVRVRATAHRLRGLAGNLCAARVMALAEEVEETGSPVTIEALERAVESTVAEIQAVRCEIGHGPSSQVSDSRASEISGEPRPCRLVEGV